MNENAKHIESFINKITIEEITEYFSNRIESDLSQVLDSIYPDPPVVIPIFKYLNYVLELTYWYPLNLGIDTDNYDPEDIHNHFGYLVTKMLVGEGYEEYLYTKINSDEVQLSSKTFLKLNNTNIISPEYIHRIIYKSNKPSLSVRVFLPNVVAEMNIYNKETGKLIETIKAPNEKRKYDFAGFLATLDKSKFANTITNISDICILESSKRQLEKLTTL